MPEVWKDPCLGGQDQQRTTLVPWLLSVCHDVVLVFCVEQGRSHGIGTGITGGGMSGMLHFSLEAFVRLSAGGVGGGEASGTLALWCC